MSVRTLRFLPALTCGFHVIILYVSHVRVQSTVQITLDNFPAEVVARTHENDWCTTGQRDGFGHEKAHYYREMEEKQTKPVRKENHMFDFGRI